MHSHDIFRKCRCILLNEQKIGHLRQILQASGVKLSSTCNDDHAFIRTVLLNDTILQSIFSPMKAPLLQSTFCYDCSNHVQTRYHKEGLDTHLLAVSILAEDFAQHFYQKYESFLQENTSLTMIEFQSLCKISGLFHDIGKPFVRNHISKKTDKHPIYTGHAQIGSRLLNQVSFQPAAVLSSVQVDDLGEGLVDLSHVTEELALVEKYRVSVEWAVNHHMCSCTHMHDVSQYMPRVGMHILLDLGNSNGEDENEPVTREHRIIAFALLSVLSYADQLGRVSEDLVELRESAERATSSEEGVRDYHPATRIVMQHSYGLFDNLLAQNPHDPNSDLQSMLPDFNGKLIIVTYGFSGSGKSYTVKRLKEKFGDDYDVIHVERDRSLYNVYEKYFGPTEGKTYEEIYATVYSYNDDSNGADTEDQAHHPHHGAAHHSANAHTPPMKVSKSTVQDQWVQDIADGLDTPQQKAGQIIILDSVQPLFPSQWNTTIRALKSTSEEAYNAFINSPKIGYSSVPIHMFGHHLPNSTSITSKTGKFFMMPPAEEDKVKGIFYPAVFTEKDDRGSSVDPALASNTLTMDEQTLLYCTGSYELLTNYIQQYFTVQQMNLSRHIAFIQGEEVTSKEDGRKGQNVFSSTMKQQSVVTIFNRIQQEHHYQTFREIFDLFLKEFLAVSRGHIPFIHYKVELEDATHQLISIIYDDGLQTFTGTTRDYRGEGVIFNKQTYHTSSIRPSLPVFPEMASIQKDPKTFPYLTSVWDEIENFRNPLYQQIRRQIASKENYKMYLVPKYDGSLFNLTFIHRSNHLAYENIHQLVQANERKIHDAVSTELQYASYYYYNDGLFLMGSKGTILSKNPVNERIHRAILGSYASVEEFLSIVYSFVTKSTELFPLAHSILTLHYEAIDAVPSPELTVFYDRAWCPYFGVTVFHQLSNTKTFHLPLDEYYPSDFKSIATIYDCGRDWSKVHEMYETNFERLLDGDETMEPEGYVLHIFGYPNDTRHYHHVEGEKLNAVEWLPIKYKYKLYYTAHKPESKHHLEMALELSSNPKYKTICQRLAKFRAKPSVQQIFEDNLILCDRLAEQIQIAGKEILKISSFDEVIEGDREKMIITKKDWALYWRQEEKIQTLITPFAMILEQLVAHYDQLKGLVPSKAMFNFLMKSYDHLILGVNSVKVLEELSGTSVSSMLQEFIF